jgi:hypothetical protein
LKVPELRIRR